MGPNGYIMGHSDGTAGASAVRSRRGVDPHGRSPHGQIGCDSLQRFHLQTLGLQRTESPFRIRIPGTYGHRHLCCVQPKRGWSSRFFFNFLRIVSSFDLISIQILGGNLVKNLGLKSPSGKIKFFLSRFLFIFIFSKKTWILTHKIIIFIFFYQLNINRYKIGILNKFYFISL